jgi:2'-5' RNA ligase
MDDFSDSIMIALLPIVSDWCRQDLPHMTLVFAGETKNQKPGAFNEIAKDASMLAMLSNPFTVRTAGVEVFGDQDKVDVIRLRPTPQLYAMRKVVEHWNASEFPFNPHLTIGPTGQPIREIPGMIAFDKVFVGWGSDQLVFSMRNSSY